MIFITLCAPIFGEQFSCDKIVSTFEHWNMFYQRHGAKIDTWARAIADSTEFRLNKEGQLEYDYVINSSDTLDFLSLKDVTINFICEYFNINNTLRSELVQGSTDRSVFFKGRFSKLAYVDIFLSRYYYDANVTFNVKFKEDRVRFTITIPSFEFYIDGKYVCNHTLYGLYPFNTDGSKNLREMEERTIINAISKSLSYPKFYLEYLNSHYTSSNMDNEDW